MTLRVRTPQPDGARAGVPWWSLPFLAADGEDDFVGPFALDGHVLDGVSFLAQPRLLQGSDGGAVTTVAAPDEAVQRVVREPYVEQFAVDLSGEAVSVEVRMQRFADLAMPVLVRGPVEDEVPNDPTGVPVDGDDAQDVLFADLARSGDVSLERRQGSARGLDARSRGAGSPPHSRR